MAAPQLVPRGYIAYLHHAYSRENPPASLIDEDPTFFTNMAKLAAIYKSVLDSSTDTTLPLPVIEPIDWVYMEPTTPQSPTTWSAQQAFDAALEAEERRANAAAVSSATLLQHCTADSPVLRQALDSFGGARVTRSMLARLRTHIANK